jgi:hypothetical protein
MAMMESIENKGITTTPALQMLRICLFGLAKTSNTAGTLCDIPPKIGWKNKMYKNIQ